MPKNAKIIVVAMTEQGLIGASGHIPWQIPEELRLFRELTSGHALIMGRRTFASIGRPLPDRRTIVVSRRLPATPGIEICCDLPSALRLAESGAGKIFFAGGVGIYRAALPLADQLSISWIRGEYAGDTYFPPFSANEWQEINEEDYGLFRRVLYRRR
ncbi:MAG: dihydrofolate reductase [Desulfuromonadaceae bacterium]|nr:dihydrofolate reductase [Desulfuromonadaceae bacterium]